MSDEPENKAQDAMRRAQEIYARNHIRIGVQLAAMLDSEKMHERILAMNMMAKVFPGNALNTSQRNVNTVAKDKVAKGQPDWLNEVKE